MFLLLSITFTGLQKVLCSHCGQTRNISGAYQVSYDSFAANVPIFSTQEDAINYIKTGSGYDIASNFRDKTMESVIDLTHVPDLAPDIPPFTRSWQQKEWERLTNTPDVIGIGSYGHGVSEDNWGDDIPWIGLESIQDYSRSLLDIYNQIINDIINGTYDSSEDIPGTYSEAWEQAISDAWQNVVEQSTDSVPGENESDKPTEGEDTDTEDPAEGEDGNDDSSLAPAQYGDDFGKMGTYVKKPDIKIDWTQITQHAIERLQQRGITQEMVNNFVENGKALSQDNGSRFAFVTKEGVAIVSEAGKLITAWSSEDFDDNMWEIIKKLFGEQIKQ